MMILKKAQVPSARESQGLECCPFGPSFTRRARRDFEGSAVDPMVTWSPMEAVRMDSVRCVIVDTVILDRTLKALQSFGKRYQECLVLWLGNVEPGRARVKNAIVPDQCPIADEQSVGYFVSGETLFELNRALSETGLRLIAQVHSHPGKAYHSEADDRYAIVTADGGFSLVVPNFGRAPANPASWAVYRLISGQWQELSREQVETIFEIDK
jgi:proteasome lid subunit RPN8/RPN11